MKHLYTTVAAVSIALLSATTPAQAAESSLTQRVISGLGNMIAAQGNNALRDIRDGLKREFTETLKPLLPDASASSAESSREDSSLQEMVQMHEQARAVQ